MGRKVESRSSGRRIVIRYDKFEKSSSSLVMLGKENEVAEEEGSCLVFYGERKTLRECESAQSEQSIYQSSISGHATGSFGSRRRVCGLLHDRERGLVVTWRFLGSVITTRMSALLPSTIIVRV